VWPGVRIEIRADAGFAVPQHYDYCEEEGIAYTIGPISNHVSKPLLKSSSSEPNRSPRRERVRR
jgi:hypothetical protein